MTDMSKKTEALKLAEDALKRVRTQDMELVQLSMIALAAIQEALAEQPAQQEPVACVQDLGEVKRKHLVYEKGMDWKDPLYTTPPQRTWVGLTDEEIMDMYNEPRSDAEMLQFARAIEAKLKEKNCG